MYHKDKMPKKKIFIADDKEDILLLLKDFLLNEDFDVMISKEPLQLVKQIKNFKPDLLVLDLLMPNLDGFELCQILNNDHETQNVPIIVMSGLKDLADIKRAYTMGVVDYYPKPFKLNNMLAGIKKAIANRENPQ